MKVLCNEPDLLLIEEDALLLRSIGAGLVVAGGALGYFLTSSRFVAFLFGGMMILVGAAFSLLPRITTITFDRTVGRIALERHGLLLPAERREVPLAQVTGVGVDRMTGDAQPTYRVVLKVSGGTDLPFTNWWTSGKESKQLLVDEVMQWMAKAK